MSLAQDAAVCERIGIKPIVIHGGGPQIKIKLKNQNIESRFILGYELADEKVIKIVEEVLLNEINPDLVNTIQQYGAKAELKLLKKIILSMLRKLLILSLDLSLSQKILI